MKEAKAKGLDVPSFYLASWNEMKEAKAKGLDVPSFYFHFCKVLFKSIVLFIPDNNCENMVINIGAIKISKEMIVYF